MNALTPTHYPKPSAAYSTGELTVELAKILALVMPITMSGEQQELWLRAAVDALQDIRASEVAAISAELRRTVTRHNQIIPEIARLVAEKRARASRVEAAPSPYFAEKAIHDEAQRRRSVVSALDKKALSDIWEWERQARIDAGLHVDAYPKRLTRAEIDAMPAHIRKVGFAHGFLTTQNGEVVEA